MGVKGCFHLPQPSLPLTPTTVKSTASSPRQKFKTRLVKSSEIFPWPVPQHLSWSLPLP